MSQEITVSPSQVKQTITAAIEGVLIGGDLNPLTPEQRVQYYNALCESISVNPLANPFNYLVLNGKLVLYANKGCAEQLRSSRKISLQIVSRERLPGDIYVVTARAIDPTGRFDESTGVVGIARLVGDYLANALMRAETKAKRRVTLSFCGLNMLDESEVDSIKDAKIVNYDYVAPKEKGSNSSQSKEGNKEDPQLFTGTPEQIEWLKKQNIADDSMDDCLALLKDKPRSEVKGILEKFKSGEYEGPASN